MNKPLPDSALHLTAIPPASAGSTVELRAIKMGGLFNSKDNARVVSMGAL